MRNLKKFLALVLAFVMAMSLMVTVNASSFSDRDTINDKYAEAVDVLQGLGIIKGDAGSSAFRPTDKITRAEVAAIIYRLVTADVKDSQIELYENSGYFSDVVDGKWYNGYVNYCANNGLVVGVGNNRFAPSDNINGYEALVMILRAIGYTNADTFTGSDWKFKASGYARELGITQNISEASLGGYATREMVAEIMFQGLQAPMVRGNILGYSEIELVAATDGNREHYKNYLTAGGTLPIYETLMHRTFNIVGKSDDLWRDNYGRPYYQWAYDNASDKTVGTMSGTPAENQGDANKYIVSASDTKTLKIAIEPETIYYEKVTECQVAKDVNSDKTLTNVSEWVNGGQIQYSFWDTANNANAYRLTRTLDALHTTTDTIGAQGRATEVYKVPGGWNIIYVDTLMGVVTNVTKRTFDTNDHVYHPATLDVLVNDNVTVTATRTDADYTYTVGDEVLLTTYGFNDTVYDANDSAAAKAYLTEPAWTSATARNAADATHAPVIDIVSGDFAIPDKTDGNNIGGTTPTAAVSDFKVSSVASGATTATEAWAVDVVGAPTTQQVTVKATVGDATDKTGLVGADNVTYPASNVYHAEAGPVGTVLDPYSTRQGTYVPDAYSINMTNNLINRTFTLYRDPRGNIVGMTEGSTNNIGVITELEPVRVGTGKWVMEADIFHADNTTSTIRLVNWNDAGGYGGNGGWEYVQSTDWGLDEKDQTIANANNVRWNALIKYEPVTLDGQTYYGVTAVATIEEDNTTPAAATGVMVETGVADSLRSSATDYRYMTTTTDIIVASTTFDYSLVDGQNTGATVLGSLKGYDGFKAMPTIVGNDNSVSFQCLDDVVYIYPKLDTDTVDTKTVEIRQIGAGVSYGFTTKPAITVDDTYLVLSTVATYQDHATYRVIKNGEVTTLDVANINDGANALNTLVESAMANNELIQVLSRDLNGYATSITGVELTQNVGKSDFGDKTNDGAIASLGTDATGNNWYLDESVLGVGVTATIKLGYNGGNIEAEYADGVLQLYFSGGIYTGPNFYESYLTVADNCKVQIVNIATGSVYDGTLESINQYRSLNQPTGADRSELVYELDTNGYVCNIYIID